MDFAIQTVRAGRSTTLVVTGEVDLANAHELTQAGLGALTDGAMVVTVDLREVTFLDSTGLAALVTINNQARSNGAVLILSGPQPRIKHLLAVTGLDTIFTIADDPAN